VYPLDEKLGLIGIRNTESRYTQRFAHILTELAAEMPMDRTADMLCQICELKLGTASIPDILDSIGAIYLPETSTDSSAAISEQELPQQQNNFIGKKIEEIEANPDKDEIIKAAVEKSNHPVKDIKGSKVATAQVCLVSEKSWKARKANKATGLQRRLKPKSVSVLNRILTGTEILFLKTEKSTDGRAITNTQVRWKT